MTHRPRVILVEKHGTLSGLVTVKDVLRFMATEKAPSGEGSGAYEDDLHGGLDEFLEELYTSGTMMMQRLILWTKERVRR